MSRFAFVALASLALATSLKAAAADAPPPSAPYVPADDPDEIKLVADKPGPAAKSAPPVKAKAGETAEPPAFGVATRPGRAGTDLKYQGVGPGQPGLPPHPPKPGRGTTKMLWPGFQVLAGVPTIFVELSAPAEWSVAEGPGQLVYTLKNTTIPLRNNQRPLRVAEFGTAVKQIEARTKGRDVLLTVQLKAPVSHRERTDEAAGGFKLLVVELTPRS